MKNFLKLTILFLLCALIGLWSPWLGWQFDLSRLFNVERPEAIAGLQVYSLAGELEVLIDGELQPGVADMETPLIVDAIEPGDRNVLIRRQGDESAAYWQFNRIITFVTGIDVVITYSLGPSEVFSEGNVISVSTKLSENFNLRVTTSVNDITLYLDGIQYDISNDTFLETITLDKQHNLRVTKRGYEDLEFTILPEAQEERDKLQDYIINIDVALMLQPVVVE